MSTFPQGGSREDDTVWIDSLIITTHNEAKLALSAALQGTETGSPIPIQRLMYKLAGL